MSTLFEGGSIAVITGAASGIGRAAARRFAREGMKIVMVDVNNEKLLAARDELAGVAGPANVSAEIVDVANAEAMTMLAAKVQAAWGAPSLLMNNAAAFVSGGKGGILDPLANWRMLFDVNVFGPINGVMAFLPGMLEAAKPAKIINTTKAALNAYTQNLAHDLRNRPGAYVSAHLLVPGWTTTGDREPQQGAWMPEQVVDYMVEALGRDDFFIVCPDGETTSDMDRKRILWNALDIVHNRPALSRWHPAHKEAFAEFMKLDLPV
jgi:NAD(P)-dependent dehydrogenase (short-subunit alcohol dehydrogenase family)